MAYFRFIAPLIFVAQLVCLLSTTSVKTNNTDRLQQTIVVFLISLVFTSKWIVFFIDFERKGGFFLNRSSGFLVFWCFISGFMMVLSLVVFTALMIVSREMLLQLGFLFATNVALHGMMILMLLLQKRKYDIFIQSVIDQNSAVGHDLNKRQAHALYALKYNREMLVNYKFSSCWTPSMLRIKAAHFVCYFNMEKHSSKGQQLKAGTHVDKFPIVEEEKTTLRELAQMERLIIPGGEQQSLDSDLENPDSDLYKIINYYRLLDPCTSRNGAICWFTICTDPTPYCSCNDIHSGRC